VMNRSIQIVTIAVLLMNQMMIGSYLGMMSQIMSIVLRPMEVQNV
jgi:hypothetical protein